MVTGRKQNIADRRKSKYTRRKIAVGGIYMEEKYIEKIIQNEQNLKATDKRLNEAESRIDDLEKTYAIMEKMDYRMGRVEDSVDKISQKLDNNYKELISTKTQTTTEKSKKWDKFIDYVFYAILAAILALVFIKIGLN